jgi:hypothetical protein
VRSGVLSSEADPPMRILANACLAAFLSTNLLAESPTSAPARIQVMVLGTYHFDNPSAHHACWLDKKIVAAVPAAMKKVLRVIQS